MTLTKQQAAAVKADLEAKVVFNEWGDLTNRHEVITYAMRKYGISEMAAYNHMRSAERRQRWQRRSEWKKP